MIRKTKATYNVTVHRLDKALTYNENQFTLFDRNYNNNYPKPLYGIKEYFSIAELVSFINNMQPVENKKLSPTVLKGIFDRGTKGEHCTLAVPYLWLDIDVKKLENVQLKNKVKNSQVFNWLKKHSIFVYRSHSGKGICACIYVPCLENIYASESKIHSKIGKAINKKLSKMILEDLGIEVEFDASQNTFRQARYLAAQLSEVVINHQPSQFDIEEEIEEVITSTGVPIFTKEFYDCPLGSIEHQYNQNTSIPDLLAQYHVNGNRYKLPGTSSETSGEYDPINNVFWNYSTSFSEYRRQTAFWLTINLFYNGNRNKLIEELKSKGYEVIKPNKSKIQDAVEKINKGDLNDEDLYSICNEYTLLSIEEKHEIIRKLTIDYSTLNKVHAYLQVTELKIQYDDEMRINQFVSEVYSKILDQSDKHSRIIVRSETGSGKTKGIFLKFLELRPYSRALIVEPLTAIVDQTRFGEKDIICLTGNSGLCEFDAAQRAKIVVATMEQAATLISKTHFDYVFVDEAHGLIVSNSYKPETIAKFTRVIENNKDIKVIGLTGTPFNIFRELGYKLINVYKPDQEIVIVIERLNNLNPYKILVEHQKQVKGKAMYRLNNVEMLEIYMAQLIENEGYKKDEILLLKSEYEVKKGEDYTNLLKDERFPDHIKIVLTTSMIDEGVSIKQMGFTDVVFIEGNEYHPRPESLKQFTARFRNIDPNRKYYYYRKTTKSQKDQHIITSDMYEISKEVLEDKFDKDKSYYDLFNNNKFYYQDGHINPYYLAFKTTNDYFEAFTLYEFREFILVNYNLKLNLDEDYTPSQQDTDFKKLKQEERNDLINQYWTSSHEEVIYIVKESTFDEDLKLKLHDYVYYIDEEVAEEVNPYLKTYEFVIKCKLRLEDLNLKPDNFLMKDGKLRATQSIRNLMKVAENLALYFYPKTESDKESSKLLRGYVKEFLDKGEFTVTQIRSRLKELNIAAEDVNKVLIDFLKCFARITPDKRRKKLVIREVYDEDWVLTHFFNIRNKKTELCPKPIVKKPTFGRQLDLFQ
ncbi:MAG: DEAD/DEAH box helicase family protein [Oceanospirillaceae bacterium]|nr:DEAD/DEAH box helicase family protein [Oceanospirillaceae bacterium]